MNDTCGVDTRIYCCILNNLYFISRSLLQVLLLFFSLLAGVVKVFLQHRFQLEDPLRNPIGSQTPAKF